jgi:hypothetical protein
MLQMSRPPTHLSPPAIVEQQKQSKFICSACGSGRDCDCNAPALERLTKIKEQARQRQIRHREREKAEQNQQPRSVTEAPIYEPTNDEPDADPGYDCEPDELALAPAPKPELAPVDPVDALVKAVALMEQALSLMPLMTANGREQFQIVFIDRVNAVVKAAIQ